ncbi:MAG: hypothetical protein COB65_06510 [Thalassobium sp.]|nr:MAG: hypothetical protein COB65_06510 [Thalassobium sp.]
MTTTATMQRGTRATAVMTRAGKPHVATAAISKSTAIARVYQTMRALWAAKNASGPAIAGPH